MATKRAGGKPKAGPKSKPKPKPKSALDAPLPTSSEHPYVHVGHGVSAARKTWGLVVVLREPLAADWPDLGAPAPLDAIDAQRGARAVTVAHDSDSLQWVVAASYADPGPRADHGEATDAQWRAFNTDLDEFLARVDERFPIAAVIRPVDDEYSTALSAWHAWSCREFPPLLPFLALALPGDLRWFLEHACALWRDWLAGLPVDEQERVLAGLKPQVRRGLARRGGALEATAAPVRDPAPALDDQLRAWAAIPAGADVDVHAAFAAAFAHLQLGGAWQLLRLVGALEAEPSPDHDALCVEVVERALASPACEWPDTHWRPSLVEALVRLGRVAAAREQAARVVAGANSYIEANWLAIVALLDAGGRRDDADAVFRAAQRYVAAFQGERVLAGRAPADQRDRVAAVLDELAAPAFADLDALDDDAVNHAAFLFEDLVDEEVASDALLAPARRVRAALAERKARRVGGWLARLAGGDALTEPELAQLVDELHGCERPDDAALVARAAVAFPALTHGLEVLAFDAHEARAEVALAVYRVVLAAPPPAADAPRASWLRCANAALILTHARKLYAESARLADAVVVHVRENPYITHSAACSYAAVERYDDAFAQAKLAVELGYEHLGRLRVDTDLGPLLERADFRALFKRKR